MCFDGLLKYHLNVKSDTFQTNLVIYETTLNILHIKKKISRFGGQFLRKSILITFVGKFNFAKHL